VVEIAQTVEGFDGLIQDIALSLSPVELFRRATGNDPDRWQVRALNSTASRQIWNVARQCGKSHLAAILALREALFNPGSLVLLVSPSLRQSSELYRKYSEAFHRVMLEGHVAAESTLRMELTNGSRVVSLPGTGDSTRGYSKVQLLLIDEASRVDNTLINALKPSLAVTKGGGKLIALSTPNALGPDNWFAGCWFYQDSWEHYEVKASQCPRISKEFLINELREQGPTIYQQEYECRFIADGAQLFDDAMVEKCMDKDFWPTIDFRPRG
jgi:Terminase large subunit, T4likevirus-type, N-terminal